MKKLETMEDVLKLRVSPSRRLFSATHEEILAGLTTDVYFVKTREILMEKQRDACVVAEVFARRDGILAGMDEVIGLLKDEDVEVFGLKEGDAFSAKEVILRIRGSYCAFGMYETALLGMLAHSSAWATAARQAKDAAGGLPVISFGARHLHPAVAPVMERAALVGGASGAACVLGAKLRGLEPVGTVPHALFLVIGDTVEAAVAYDEVMHPSSPRNILVDTFKDEVEESLRVASALQGRLQAVRLDTPSERGGVTVGLVRELRAKLDLAGFSYVKIFASGGLTPERIALLKEAGVEAFGVGSYISAAAPIDMTMDLKEVNGCAIAKRGRIPGMTENPRLKRLL